MDSLGDFVFSFFVPIYFALVGIQLDLINDQMSENKDAAEAWDELEKSIVANIADGIKVKILGKKVEITVCKAF